MRSQGGCKNLGDTRSKLCYGSVILSGAKSSVIMSCMNKTVALNPQEQQRINVLNEHLRGDLSIAQVAALLKCSQRHIYRLKASYRERGVEAMMHGNRGKRSPRRISEEVRQHVSKLAQGK